MTKPTHPPSDLDLLAFAADAPWRAAKGVYEQDGLRHEYVARQHVDDQEAFTRFAQACLDHGYPRKFGKWRYRYLELGQHRHWICWGSGAGCRVINRCPIDAPWQDPRGADGQMRLEDR